MQLPQLMRTLHDQILAGKEQIESAGTNRTLDVEHEVIITADVTVNEMMEVIGDPVVHVGFKLPKLNP